MRRSVEGVRRFLAAVARWAIGRARVLGLSARGAWLLASAAAAVVVSGIVAAGVSEDVTQHNGAALADPQRLQVFVGHRPDWLVAMARAVTAVGAVGVLGAIAIAAAALLWWRGQRLLVAVAPGIALGCAGAAVALVKPVVGRVRPDLAVRLVADSEASFPSGHSADSAALLIALAIVVAAVILRRPLTRALTVAAAALASGAIGLSRLVLAAHWPTDVIAGWALGLAVGVTVSTLAVLASRLTPPDPAQPTRLRARIIALLFTQRRSLHLRPFTA